MKYTLIVAVLLCSPGIVIAQSMEKLVAADATAEMHFGRAVAIDGDTAVIGTWEESGYGAGSAYVFTRNPDGSWSQQAKLISDDIASGDLFGNSVAVDGDTAVVGAFTDDDNGSNSGSAYVFTRNAGVWTQQAKLIADDGASGDLFGRSVSVDGDTALVGSPQDDETAGNSGSAYVFTRDAGGAWAQQARLNADNVVAYALFGHSVSLGNDTALIGAYRDGDLYNDYGSAYVFTRNGADEWTQQAKLVADDFADGDRFGNSVSLSGDTAIVGAPYNQDVGYQTGSAYIFNCDAGGAWTQQAKLLASDGSRLDVFGWTVSVDGDVAVVGAFGDDDRGSGSGSIYLFNRDTQGSWFQHSKLTAFDGGSEDNFGYAVALMDDRVLAGATDDNGLGGTDQGSAYISTICNQRYALVAEQWSLISLPCSPNASVEDLFGDDSLGVYGTDWGVVERVEESDSYRLLLASDTIEQGVGYWIQVLGGDSTIDVFGDFADDSQDFEVSLETAAGPGRWNLVGHPFTFDVNWSDVKVVNGAGTEYAMSNPTAADFITDRTMYKWNGSSYQSYHPDSNPTVLSTYDGFWIRAKAGSSLRIPATPSDAAESTENQRLASGWWVQLIATADGYSDPGNRIGRFDVATDGQDEYDLKELEPFSSPYLTLVIPHPEWPGDAWSFTTDFRQLRSNAGGSWDLEIRSDTARDVSLAWHVEGVGFQDILTRSQLVNPATGETITPAADGSYTFSMASQVHPLSWRINSLPALAEGESFTGYAGLPQMITVPFIDEDADDFHSVTFDWGGGIHREGVVDEEDKTVSGGFTFTRAGTYAVNVCIEDGYGATDCVSCSVQISELASLIFADSFEPGDISNWTQRPQ